LRESVEDVSAEDGWSASLLVAVQLPSKRRGADAELLSREGLAAVIALEHGKDVIALHVAETAHLLLRLGYQGEVTTHVPRKVVDIYHVVDGHDAGELHRILELAYVAWPRVPHDCPEGGWRIAADRPSHPVCHAFQQRLGEDPHVLWARSEWRDDNLDDAQPVEQVAAEPAFRDLLDEIAVGRGDHANVYRPEPVPADAPDLSLLENAEELHLHRQRDFAYFVEQEGSAVRFFENPRAVQQGTCECTSCVPEQLALEKTLDDGPAIHSNEFVGSSQRCLVNELGETLFAYAALTDDQDGGVESGDLRSAVKRFLHRGAGHTETKFVLGAMPVRPCPFHDPVGAE
jgi:hypothetical protein